MNYRPEDLVRWLEGCLRYLAESDDAEAVESREALRAKMLASYGKG